MTAEIAVSLQNVVAKDVVTGYNYLIAVFEPREAQMDPNLSMEGRNLFLGEAQMDPTLLKIRVELRSRSMCQLLEVLNALNDSGSHKNLRSLLFWGLCFHFDSDFDLEFDPFLTYVAAKLQSWCFHFDSDYEFSQVFNSLVPDIHSGTMEPIDCEFSVVLKFSFLKSLLAIEGRITHPSEHNQLFNSLISATHTSFLSNPKEIVLGKDEFKVQMQTSCSKMLSQAQQKACLLLGPVETHRFMYYWTSVCNTEEFFYGKEQYYLSIMKISYNSNIGGFWKITSYSPLSSMETTSGSPTTERRLREALDYHLLHCTFQFRNVLKFCPHWIEVCLEMDNVRCDVIPLEKKEYHDTLPNERHFPAKICLTIGPQNGCVLQSVSLAKSSQNPLTDIGKGNIYEVTFEPPQKVGLKAAVSTAYTDKIKNWGFEQSAVEDKDADIDWTLYDSTTGKAVFNSGPPKFSALGPKTWSIDRYSKASRAFTEKGGVVFAGDEYRSPITWRLNRDLEGQTLKWVVKGSVRLTYRPNTHRTRYSEAKSHDFCPELDLTLVDPSGPAPT